MLGYGLFFYSEYAVAYGYGGLLKPFRGIKVNAVFIAAQQYKLCIYGFGMYACECFAAGCRFGGGGGGGAAGALLDYVPRKLFAGKVLVYNRGNALKIARIVAHNGYSAAAHGDHHKARIVKRFHGVKLNYFNRQRRCDYPAPAAARVLLHCIALFFGYGLGFFFGIEGAYGL